MVVKASKGAVKDDRKLLILKNTKIDGKVVRRGEVVPYPREGGALLCGAANKAVIYSKEAAAAFEADEKRRVAREKALAEARGEDPSTQAGTPQKPPKN